MEMTILRNILLLALAKAYDGQKNAYIMLEDIAPAILYLEQVTPELHGGHSSRATGALITLESQKLVRMERGRVYLTAAGINACQGSELPPGWSALPNELKKRVKTK
ncbi:hypothetical protein HZC53_00570 [Candidatus Uhrbacteria bacterium]|nr:hypothetical protein [Candidatus Uhrbacteria bacterium]